MFAPQTHLFRWKPSPETLFLVPLLAVLGFQQPGVAQVLLANIKQESLTYLLLSPDGQTLALVPEREGSHPTDVELWDVTDKKAPKRRAVLTGHKEWVGNLTFSPDGRLLAVGGNEDQMVKLWDVATGKQKLTIQTPSRGPMAFSPDSKMFAVGVWNAAQSRVEVKLYDPTTGREFAALSSADERQVYRLVFSPDGKTLATSSGHKEAEVKLWDVATRRVKATLPGAEGVMDVLFAPDGKLLATWNIRIGMGPEGTELKLWDAATGRLKAQLTGHKTWIVNAAFSPDGRTLVTGGGIRDVALPKGRYDLENTGELKLWEVATGKVRADLAGHQDLITAVAFSPDGRLLASVGGHQYEKRGEAMLWDLATAGKKWARLPGQTNSVSFVAFKPDGRTVLTAGREQAVKLWDVSGLLDEGRLPPPRLSSAELEALWTELAGEDAAKAYRSAQTLIRAGKQAERLLGDRLRPVSPADPQLLARLIKDLDSDQFVAREEAEAALRKFEGLAEPALRQALQGKPSLEMRRRLNALLQNLERPVSSPESVRGQRAVEVLEHVGTPEARAALERLAQGTPEASLTQAAKDALGRLAKHTPRR